MFTLTVVGVLAAVAIPSYLIYIQKSRTISQIFPQLHSIESNVAFYYSTTGNLPGSTQLLIMTELANTQYFTPEINAGVIKLTIDSPATTSKLYRFHGLELFSSPLTGQGRIIRFVKGGSLALNLGINDD